MWHEIPYRVIFSDTDAGGIVYHARYFEIAERGRNEALRSVGLAGGGFNQIDDLGFVLRNAKIKFLKPVLMDDLLLVKTQLLKYSSAKSVWLTNVVKERSVVCEIIAELVCIDVNTKSAQFASEVITDFLAKLSNK